MPACVCRTYWEIVHVEFMYFFLISFLSLFGQFSSKPIRDDEPLITIQNITKRIDTNLFQFRACNTNLQYNFIILFVHWFCPRCCDGLKINEFQHPALVMTFVILIAESINWSGFILRGVAVVKQPWVVYWVSVLHKLHDMSCVVQSVIPCLE